MLTKKFIKGRYDIIHIHSVPDFEIFAGWFPKLMGAKIILDIHDIVPEFYASKFNKKQNNIIYKMLIYIEKLSIAFSDHVIIANDIWRDKLIKRSAKKNKCTAILNYPDNNIFYERPRQKNKNKFIILYPGTLNWHQGLDIAIKAIAIIKDKVKEVELHIYGTGGEEDNLRSLIISLGLEKKVFLKGAIHLNQVPYLMSYSDLGIVPKRNNSFGGEAFSTKILEFMSVGVPVIVSATKIDKYYFNESIVTFFKPGDENDLAKKVLSLSKNNEMRDTLARNALNFIHANNWNVKKKIYIDLIDKLAINSIKN